MWVICHCSLAPPTGMYCHTIPLLPPFFKRFLKNQQHPHLSHFFSLRLYSQPLEYFHSEFVQWPILMVPNQSSPNQNAQRIMLQISLDKQRELLSRYFSPLFSKLPWNGWNQVKSGAKKHVKSQESPSPSASCRKSFRFQVTLFRALGSWVANV